MRVPDLHAFRRAIASCACRPDVADTRATAVLLSSAAAASELQHSLENMLLGDLAPRPVVAWPDLVTRDGWYARLHRALDGAPRRLSPIEREVLLARAATRAVDAGHVPPFAVRPALIAEMLGLLDTILRLNRTLDAFERLLVDTLEPATAMDRGAARLLDQTRFLVAAFRGYRKLAVQSGAVDEHLLRDRLLASETRLVYSRVVVTVGDRGCGQDGLWPVDFDLLTRLAHLEHVDVVVTEAVLTAGFLERLHDLLPGAEEIEFGHPAALSGRVPTLVSPAGAGAPYWISRDREEEIAAIARQIKRNPVASLDRTAIVCRRPLPYVYLAQSYLEAAGIPVQAFDALPLAAEPFAAAFDLVFAAVESSFARRPLVALLRSPHFVFADADGVVAQDEVTALDERLRESSYRGGADLLAWLADQWSGPEAPERARAAARAGRVAAAAARDLEPLLGRHLSSRQFEILLAFLIARCAPADPERPALAARTTRARDTILGALRQLQRAHREYDDPVSGLDELVSRVHRWIEDQTFSPRTGTSGAHLVDADAARYGDFDEVHLVGLVEREWPEKAASSIFYPQSLLAQLGWTPERQRLQSARAMFRDLVRLAGHRALASAFLLEDDALVEPSPFLDELERSGLAVAAVDPPDLRVCPDDALSMAPARPDVLASPSRERAELRAGRSSAADAKFHGTANPVRAGSFAVGQVEIYLACPFKYFAQALLRLEDLADDDPDEGPRAQGIFLHRLLGEFFERWHASGRRAITADNIEYARAMFGALVGERLSALPAAEAQAWRARLLGSAARTGIGEVVLRLEASSGQEVVSRLLEQRFDGPCRLETPAASRRVTLRGIADRIDLLEGGRFRIIDYKLGRAPNVKRAIQLPVYAVLAQQSLGGASGEAPTAAEVGYLAFGASPPYVKLASKAADLPHAITEGIDRALSAIDGIERGLFPPSPAERFSCSYCPYAAVCRKDYVDGR